MRRLLLFLLLAAPLHAQTEQGTFTLYKFAAPIGKEAYRIGNEDGHLKPPVSF